MFGSSTEEMAAGAEVLSNFPSAQTIMFETTNIQIILTTEQPIIWIGHGISEGIIYQNTIIKWDLLAELITSSVSNNHIMVSCRSSEANNYISSSSKIVVGFSNQIDAIYGANLASLVVGMIYGLDKQRIDGFHKKLNQRVHLSERDPEYMKLGFSAEEGFMRFSKGGLAVMAAVYAASAAYMGVVMNFYAMTIFTSLSAFWIWMYKTFEFVNNPDGITVSSLSLWIAATSAFIVAVIGRLALAHRIALGATLGIDTTTQIVATVVLVGTVAYAIYQLSVEVPRWRHDYNDCNDLPAEADNFVTSCCPITVNPGPPGGYR